MTHPPAAKRRGSGGGWWREWHTRYRHSRCYLSLTLNSPARLLNQLAALAASRRQLLLLLSTLSTAHYCTLLRHLVLHADGAAKAEGAQPLLGERVLLLRHQVACELQRVGRRRRRDVCEFVVREHDHVITRSKCVREWVHPHLRIALERQHRLQPLCAA